MTPKNILPKILDSDGKLLHRKLTQIFQRLMYPSIQVGISTFFSLRGSRSGSAIPDSISEKEKEGIDRMHAWMDGWIDE